MSSWFDFMWVGDVERYSEYVDSMHGRGIYVVCTQSMITTYQYEKEEPAELAATILRNPFGELVSSDYGLGETMGGTQTWYIHSMLHPTWQDMLLDEIKMAIDYGADGILIDELPYGAAYEPDFTEYTMQLYNEYHSRKTPEEINDILEMFEIATLDDLDYTAEVCAALDQLEFTSEDWRNWEVQQSIPLFEDYQRFIRVENKKAIERIITEAKAYAEETQGRVIPFSGNFNDLSSQEAVYCFDLVDFADMECSYNRWGWFPMTRNAASVRLAAALGKKGYVLTAMDTRGALLGRGPETTRNFYRTAIADAYASGGAFYVEEGGHGLQQDIPALTPYYRFPLDNLHLFEGVEPVEPEICVLHLWENLDAPHYSKAFHGTSNLLADSGYQFDVVFGAEEYLQWGKVPRYPAPDYPLTLEMISGYPLVIVPELVDLTSGHAAVLLDYVEGGGVLVVFSSPGDLDTLVVQRGADPSISQLVGFLNDMEVDVGAGRVIRPADRWGSMYASIPDTHFQGVMRGLLEQEGFMPQVGGMPDAFISAFQYNDGSRLITQLVNYDYNWNTDVTTAADPMELELTLPGSMAGADLSVTFYSPEAPPQALASVIEGGVVHVTTPGFSVWGVIEIVATS
ncbi:hypothetical protein E2P65_03890 [Candidatus Bathyarchaeota archaeon]|nr:hypothetical protein E2P65_03890 [Candidatus Bathyarchaeota archaeon]